MDVECIPEVVVSENVAAQNMNNSFDVTGTVEAMDTTNNETGFVTAIKSTPVDTLMDDDDDDVDDDDDDSNENCVDVNDDNTELIEQLKTKNEQGVQFSGLREPDKKAPTSAGKTKNEQGVQCSGLREPGKKVPTSVGGRRPMHACNSCNRMFSTKRDLVTHQYMHRENPKLSCAECTKAFTTETAYIRHVKSHSKKPTCKGGSRTRIRKVCTCHQCNKVFDTMKELTTHHMKNHVEQKTFVCEICGSQFAWAENLRAHKQSHEINPHECEKCGRRFVDATSLRVHTRNSHGPNSEPLAPRKIFSCDICGRAYQFDFSLRAHMKGHGPSSASANAKQEQSVTNSSSVLQQHYVQMNQEGMIDLGEMTGSQENTNEIIIEVYNYGNSAEIEDNGAHLMELKPGDLSAQSHQQESVNNKDVSLQRVESREHSVDHTETESEADVLQSLFSEAHRDISCVTSERNPVSIDESGMCITVSAEALPKLLDMEMSRPPEAEINTSDVANNKIMAESYNAEIAMQPEVAKPGVQYTNATGLGNTELVWYAPPEGNDDQNAMIVWYQPPEPTEDFNKTSSMGDGDTAKIEWNQKLNDTSSSVDASNETYALNSEAKNNTPHIEQMTVFEDNNDNYMDSNMTSYQNNSSHNIIHDGYSLERNGHAPVMHATRRGKKTRPREPFLFNCVMTDEKPFVCLKCGEAFRWEISLNVHLREHNGTTTNSGRGHTVRGQTRSAGVRVKMSLPARTGSARNSDKLKNSVGRSRIVPRTASSSEEDDGDEFCFHIQPEEETGRQQLRLNASRGLDKSETKISSNGRGATRGLRVRGMGPRKRGTGSRLTTMTNIENFTIKSDANNSVSVFEGGKCNVTSTTPAEPGVSAAQCVTDIFNGNTTCSRESVQIFHSGEKSLQLQSQMSTDMMGSELVNLFDVTFTGKQMSMDPNKNISSEGMKATGLQKIQSSLLNTGNYDKTVNLSDGAELVTAVISDDTPGDQNNKLQLDPEKECGKLSLKLPTVQRSRRQLHVCGICSHTFSNKKDLVLHQYMHIEVEKLSCIECNKTFKTKTTYLRHVRSHNGTTAAVIIIPQALPQECQPLCDNEPISAALSESAIVTQHNLDNSEVVELANVQIKLLKFRRSSHRICSFCLICQRVSTTLRAVCRHRRNHLLSKSGRQQVVQCNACSALFPLRSDLLLHQRICSLLAGCRCRLCGRVFTSRSLLFSHLHKHAPRVHPSTCKHCSKRFFDVNKCNIHESLHVDN